MTETAVAPGRTDTGEWIVPTNLSPSRVESFLSCPLAFRFSSIQKLPDMPTVHTTRGSLVHRALELFFLRPADERLPAVLDACTDEAIREYATHPDFIGRVRESTNQIIHDHPGERIAAVCHGGVISIILNDIFGLPMETYHPAHYTSVTRIRASRDGRRSMLSFNESHWLRTL